MAQEFCLKWSNHLNILKAFTHFLSSEKMVDVTLVCDGRSLKAHKLLLSACSPFFRILFEENPCKHPIVILKDYSFTELKAILEFMYCGEVNVSESILRSLINTAKKLQIDGLEGVVVTPDGITENASDGELFEDQSDAESVSTVAASDMTRAEQLFNYQSSDAIDETEIKEETLPLLSHSANSLEFQQHLPYAESVNTVDASDILNETLINDQLNDTIDGSQIKEESVSQDTCVTDIISPRVPLKTHSGNSLEFQQNQLDEQILETNSVLEKNLQMPKPSSSNEESLSKDTVEELSLRAKIHQDNGFVNHSESLTEDQNSISESVISTRPTKKIHLDEPTTSSSCNLQVNDQSQSSTSQSNPAPLGPTTKKYFRCEICVYAYFPVHDRESHMLIHADQKPFPCDQCDQAFRQEHSLIWHKSLYHATDCAAPSPKEKIKECSRCGVAFRRKSKVKQQPAIHVDPKASVTEGEVLRIGEPTVSKEEQADEEEAYEEVEGWVLKEYGGTLNSPRSDKDLQPRSATGQEIKVKPQVPGESHVQPSTMAQCEVRLSPLPSTSKHVSSQAVETSPAKELRKRKRLRKSSEKSVQQSSNLQSFEGNTNIASSSRNVLNNIANSGCDVEEKVFKCPMKSIEDITQPCPFKSRYKKNLRRHLVDQHQRKELLECTECSFITTYRKTLARHLKRVHHKSSNLQCCQCDYKCDKSYRLKRHVESVHEGKKPFSCEYCDFQSAEKSGLKKHRLCKHGKKLKKKETGC